MHQNPHDILVVDDEEDIRSLVSGILEDEGYNVRTAKHSYEALEQISRCNPTLIVLDVWLGDNQPDGLKVLEILQKENPHIPVIIMSGHGNIETAVQAIRSGAYDFIEKPFQSERLLVTIERAISAYALRRENTELKRKVHSSSILVGHSPVVSQLRQAVERIGSTAGRVFISGASGSDKEGLARTLHNQSKRKESPFIVLRCQDIHPSDIEATLFGSEASFQEEGLEHSTASKKKNTGLVEKAHTGTLYFDEITHMPLGVQSKVSKLLQEQSFCRLGSQESIQVNVRFMAGSSDNVQAMVKEGMFKEHLYYRLSVHHLNIPSIADHLADLPEIINHLLKEIADAYNKPVKILTEDALVLMQAYKWPGDLQQLKHIVEWLVLSNQGDKYIRKEMLPPEILTGNSFATSWKDKSSDIIALPLREAREVFEKEYLVTQVSRFSGNISQTAKFVGMERSALHRKLRNLGMNDVRED